MGHEETVYDSLANAHDDAEHWAFGSGFDDPLAGVDTTVPDGVDTADLGAYCLMLGDDALVLAQKTILKLDVPDGEWPMLGDRFINPDAIVSVDVLKWN